MVSLRPQDKEGKSLSSWVVSRLTEAILNGEFEPGEKLDQELIATKLEMSRTPVREAMKELAAEGFVELRAFRGVYIPILTPKDVQDIYEIRWIIESEIVRQATPVIPDNELERLEDFLKQGKLIEVNHKEKCYYDEDLQFHGLFASYCPNKLFNEILDKLNRRIVRVRTFALHQSGTHLNISHVEHIAILNAVRARDAYKAGELMEFHLRNSANRIIKNMDKP